MRVRSPSNVTPRLRAVLDGDKTLPLKDKDDVTILERCCVVPTRRYSVLEGLTTSRFEESQPWTESKADDKRDKVSAWSCDENKV